MEVAYIVRHMMPARQRVSTCNSLKIRPRDVQQPLISDAQGSRRSSVLSANICNYAANSDHTFQYSLRNAFCLSRRCTTLHKSSIRNRFVFLLISGVHFEVRKVRPTHLAVEALCLCGCVKAVGDGFLGTVAFSDALPPRFIWPLSRLKICFRLFAVALFANGLARVASFALFSKRASSQGFRL